MECNCLEGKPDLSKDELLHEIMTLAFSVNDLALYLDTHPCDKKALSLHNEYSMKMQKLTDEYQENYGPLTNIDSNSNEWDWINNPWPWERGAY